MDNQLVEQVYFYGVICAMEKGFQTISAFDGLGYRNMASKKEKREKDFFCHCAKY
jgi:hypothetical protein